LEFLPGGKDRGVGNLNKARLACAGEKGGKTFPHRFSLCKEKSGHREKKEGGRGRASQQYCQRMVQREEKRGGEGREFFGVTLERKGRGGGANVFRFSPSRVGKKRGKKREKNSTHPVLNRPRGNRGTKSAVTELFYLRGVGPFTNNNCRKAEERGGVMGERSHSETHY